MKSITALESLLKLSREKLSVKLISAISLAATDVDILLLAITSTIYKYAHLQHKTAESLVMLRGLMELKQKLLTTLF